MEKVIFMSLMPDDYHGAPMILDFTEDDFPIPPSEQEVFNAWSDAGYNSWEMGGDPDTESVEDYFRDYGNYECYYSTYMIFTNSNNIDQLKHNMEDSIAELSYEGELVSVDAVCNVIRNQPGVIDVYTIDFNR